MNGGRYGSSHSCLSRLRVQLVLLRAASGFRPGASGLLLRFADFSSVFSGGRAIAIRASFNLMPVP